MKLLKILSIILIISIMFSFSTINFTFAHEIGSAGGYRWSDVRMEGMYTKYAYVKINGDNITNNLSTRYSAAVSHWTNNSAGKVRFVDTDFNYSNCDLCVPTSNFWIHDNNVIGITYLKNYYDEWNTTNPYSSNTNFTNGMIESAVIYFNPDESKYNTTTLRNYLLRHEMGHVLGLGHPGESTASIMHPYISSPWSTVQDHDRNDLINFYQ